jgi:DNA-directed RNA polymerase III subunit RPC2
VAARSNQEIRSDPDPKFYTDIYVGEPKLEEEAFVTTNSTPFQCRLRDCTHSTRQRQIVTKHNIQIGSIPIVLRSEKCILNGKSAEELAHLKEYFVVKGNEKVILMHEQLSKVGW